MAGQAGGNTKIRSVVISMQQFEIIEGIQQRRQCSFSEALRRVLDSWIDALAEGKVKSA